MTDFSSILYSRGYIFSNKECSVPKHFVSLTIPTYYFYHDKNNDAFFYENGANNWILICGLILDASEGDGDIKSIGKKLLEKREISELEFLDYLDCLGGRYIILIKYDNDLRVYNDACGNKNVNYLFIGSDVFLSSHLKLLNENSSLVLSSVEKERVSINKTFRYGYPGMGTPYDNVKKLTPNTSLNLKTKDIERYFPREDLKEKKLEEAYQDIKKLFNNQFKALIKLGFKPLISLTAGLDSRFTISILEDLSKAEFFTYSSLEAHEVDTSIAKTIANKLALKHSILDTNAFVFDENYIDYNAVVSENTFSEHGREISYMYFNSFKEKKYVHIRSNLSEIGRFFYGKSNDYQLNELSLLFLWGSINKEFISSATIRNAFREFFIKNKYYDIYNYNAFDLFYWEHRMGQWNSEVLIEGDPAFNTVQLFNSRAVLKNLLALSVNDRKNNVIYQYAVLEKGRKELANVPINPESVPINPENK